MTVTVRINFASRARSLPLPPPIYVRRMDLPKDSTNKPNAYKNLFFPLLKNNNNKTLTPCTIFPLCWDFLHNTEKTLRDFVVELTRRENNVVLSFLLLLVVFPSLACGH